jgi:nucleoside-diphosphate-sugar epimerase
MSKKICIVGASGFVGRHLAQTLMKQKHKGSKLLTRGVAHMANRSADVEIISGDLLKIDSLSDFVNKGDIVVNLAYLQNETTENNLLAVKNLASICKQAKVSHLVHLSTAAVVGVSKENIITPEARCYPHDSYEITKCAIENVLSEELMGYCQLSILRPTAIFGENGQNLVKMIHELKNSNYWVNAARISLHGKRKMNLVSVDNVVAAILFLANLNGTCTNERYIISDDDDEFNNYADVVNIVTTSLKLSRPPKLELPFQTEIMSLMLRLKNHSNTNLYRTYSSEKLMRLGFRKKITFKQALLNYLMGCEIN